MLKVKYPVALISIFIWIGFVCALSFLEAWLKFQAPGITLSLGLGIGRLVFNALNKVEWVLATSIIANYLWEEDRSISFDEYICFLIPLAMLIIQTIWLLPALDARAEMQINKQILPSSNLHFYYVGFELIKVFLLFVFGIKLFKKNVNGTNKYHSGY
jgi:hypothetical protein